LFFDYEKGNLKFIIDKNTKEKDIDFINNLIIEGKNIDIITNKKCDIWKKYNTLFIPKIKKFF
jgi:hypothetical protein